jgi:hypothetical protein
MENTNGNAILQRGGWIALLTFATFLGSFIFACATPFAALGALAALFLPRRDAFLLTGINWFLNQFVGYAFLHYPQTWDSFGWGAAIGAGAFVCTGVAIGAVMVLRNMPWILAALGTFAAAFTAYELALFAATAVLPSGGGFSLRVILYVLDVNGLAFIGLLVLQGLGRTFGLAPPASIPTRA